MHRYAVAAMLVCPAMESVPGAIATGSHDVWWRSRHPVANAPGTDLILTLSPYPSLQLSLLDRDEKLTVCGMTPT
jgi:hypothetical protein